jgi:hypothetical protein
MVYGRKGKPGMAALPAMVKGTVHPMIDDSGLALLYEKADRYKNRIASARWLGVREAKNLDAYFKIGLTFSSNTLEGNTLTITETKVLLEDGLTVGGSPYATTTRPPATPGLMNSCSR